MIRPSHFGYNAETAINNKFQTNDLSIGQEIINQSAVSEFDQMVTEARSMSDFDTRYQIYEELNQTLVDDAPYIYMYNKLEIRAYAPYVKGFVTRSDQANNFWNVWLDQ